MSQTRGDPGTESHGSKMICNINHMDSRAASYSQTRGDSGTESHGSTAMGTAGLPVVFSYRREYDYEKAWFPFKCESDGMCCDDI